MMKKLIFALLIPLFLVSCYWDADFVDVIYKEIPTVSEEIGEETGPGSLPYYLKEDDGTVYITEEEIDTLMQAYLLYEKYTVYDSSSMIDFPQVTDENGIVAEVEITEEYMKVNLPEYDTWDEWIAFIESIFWGDELMEETERMENDKKYINRDGYTYVRLGEMGWYISRDYTAEVLWSELNFAQVKIVRKQRYPAEEERDYTKLFFLQKNDGTWRIADITDPE